jgi:hypothetical protein
MAATMTGWYPGLGLAVAAVLTAIAVGPGADPSVTSGPMVASDPAAPTLADVPVTDVVVSNPEAPRAGSVLSAPKSAAEATPVLTDSGFVVQASEAWSLTVVDGPSSTPVGAWIECSYLSIPSVDAPIESLGPVVPWAGGAFDLWCWHEPDHVAVAGYPQVVLYNPLEPVPGLVDVIDVAEYAQSQIEFEPPAMQFSPAERQVVGIETWLAVTSELDYPDVSAQAGLAWATVRTRFRDAVWDLGDGSVLTCTDDATTTWDPTAAVDQQTSDCTHTYVESSADSGYPASVTVTWALEWTNNDAPDVFVPWTTFSLATPVSIAVDQLQAVIR